MRSASRRSEVADPSPARPAPQLRGLRYFLAGAVLLLAAAIAWALFLRPRQAPRPLALLETADGVAQRALNLDTTRTRRGLPAFRVRAREALTFNQGNIELHDVSLTVYGSGKEPTEVSAPLAVSGEGSPGGWSFRNGVQVKGEGGLMLQMPELHYRESPQEISSTEQVNFARGDLKGSAVGLRYIVARRRLELLSAVSVTGGTAGAGLRKIDAETAAMDQGVSRITFARYKAQGAAGEEITGAALDLILDEDSKVRRIEATGGFVAKGPGGAQAPSGTGTPAAALLGAAARELSGATMNIDLDGKGQARAVHVEGNASMKSLDPAEGLRALECATLDIALENGKPSTMDATGKATLSLARSGPGSAAGTTAHADRIHATLDPVDGSVRSVEATGAATVQDAGRRSSAATIRLDLPSNVWVLEGGDGGTARVEGEGSVVSASHIEVRRADGSLSARGDVKTMTTPRSSSEPADASPSRGAPGLFGGESGPVHGMAATLTASRAGKAARYRDHVRIWQGEASLEAASIDILDDGAAVEAHGSVVARMPAQGDPNGAKQTVTLSAPEMSYSRDKGEVSFTGGARALSGNQRIDADVIRARTGEGGQGMREMIGEGKVRFQQGARVGQGDLLEADLREKRYVLTGRGRLAIIQDQSSQQVVKGSVLTYEGSTDRILVESESGGRTWITLKPRPGEGKQ